MNMIGRVIRLSDYKFVYGQETVYINVYGVFKNKKNGNKYIVYSYDNKKIYYGSFFVRDNAGTVMVSKDINKDIVKDFIDDIISNKQGNWYEIISLESIESIQIIDELEYDLAVDVDRLNELTIPKVIDKEEEKVPKKKNSFFAIGIMLLLIILSLFFIVNPEVILGKNIIYSCSRTYSHDKLPAAVTENRIIVFNSKEEIISMDINTDYVFNDYSYYDEFKNKSYFYNYIDEADTYKFDDNNHTYRIFSTVDVNNNYFLPNLLEELIEYFENNGYNCKTEEE